MPGIKWRSSCFREDSYPFESQRFELDVMITYKYILMHFQPTEEHTKQRQKKNRVTLIAISSLKYTTHLYFLQNSFAIIEFFAKVFSPNLSLSNYSLRVEQYYRGKKVKK